MKPLMRLLGTPLTRDELDARMVRWICFGCGLTQFCLAVVLFARHAHHGLELAAGLMLSLLVFGLVTLCGMLTSRLALMVPKIPLRRRGVELVGYTLAIAILCAGCWVLPMFALDRAGVIMGLLAMLGLSMSAICAGAWWTCHRQPALASGRR